MVRKGECICSGDLNRFMTVQRIKPNATVNSGGQIDESDESNWINSGKQWCKLIPKNSREFMLGDQLNEEITHQITMRCTNTTVTYVTTKTRLIYNGRQFNLSGPPMNVDEQDRWLMFSAIEKP